jgi:glutamate-1-semialdehyde 2,1-aminomutase
VLKKPSDTSNRYSRSEAFLERAERVIPLGSQTFSKSRTQYPLGVSPLFIERGRGSRTWDLDGNEYIDFVSALAAINLGHCDPDVTAAVHAQLEEGTIFSLPHPLETIVAEKIVEMVPCAEKVRYGKNGSDATAGATRLARAFTRRDRVAVCGYHGWQDWYIGSTARHLGVPDSVRALTHTFPYNDIEALATLLRAHDGEFAAIILEPMNVTEPKPGYLEGVRELATRHGAVLVFDETITGFRYANGGAQERFGVTPDLATFGKGIANGYPLSVVAGRADMMRLMEEVFFSFTFGGETLSLAAADATLDKLRREPVVATLRKHGEMLLSRLRPLIEQHGLAGTITASGDPTWSFLLVGETKLRTQFETKTLLLQELFARDILFLGTHNLTYAHSENDIERLLSAYDEVLLILAEFLSDAAPAGRFLRCEPLVPLFRVR